MDILTSSMEESTPNLNYFSLSELSARRDCERNKYNTVEVVCLGIQLSV